MRQLKITKSITNRESASLDKYLQEIGKEELITVPFTEASFENAVIEIFRDQLGYTYYYGPDVARDYHDPIFLQHIIIRTIFQ